MAISSTYPNNNPSGEDRSLKRTVLLGVFVVLFPLLLFFTTWFLGNGRLELSLPSDGGTYALQVINQSDGKEILSDTTKETKVSLTLGSGSYEIRVFSDDKRASSYVANVPRFYGKSSQTIAVKNQAKREKLGRGVMSCPVYSGEILYSYECGFSQTLARHTQLSKNTYSERLDRQTDGLVAAAAYRDGGVLMLRVVSREGGLDVLVELLKDGKVIISKPLPQEFTENKSGTADFSLVINSEDEGSFAVAKKDEGIQLLYFSDIGNSPRSIRIDTGNVEVNELATSFALRGNQLMAAYGESGHGQGHHNDDGGQKNKAAVSQVKLVDVVEGKTVSEYELAEAFLSIEPCGNRFCVLQEGVILVFGAAGKELIQLAEYGDVDTMVKGTAGKVVYKQENKLYELDANELSTRLLFLTDNFEVTDIHPAGSSTLVTARLANARTSTVQHVFLLSSEPAEDNTFADYKLPYAPGTQDRVVDMDYSGRNILVSILLDSSVLDVNDRITFKNSEFQAVTKEIKGRLSRDGFSEPDFDIRFVVNY